MPLSENRMDKFVELRENSRDIHPATNERENRQNQEREPHNKRAFMQMIALVFRPSEFSRKKQIVKPEHIKRGAEGSGQTDDP